MGTPSIPMPDSDQPDLPGQLFNMKSLLAQKPYDGMDSLRRTLRLLRLMTGLVGAALPLILVLVAVFSDSITMRPSLSAYYHANTFTRDLFVGSLCVIGFFLLAYNDHDTIENWLTNLAGMFLILVAFLPSTPNVADVSDTAILVGTLHTIFAAIAFGLLALVSLWRFPKEHPKLECAPSQPRRKRIYKICGGMMFLCMLLMVLTDIVTEPGDNIAFYWFETVTIEVFGIAWLAKSREILMTNSVAWRQLWQTWWGGLRKLLRR